MQDIFVWWYNFNRGEEKRLKYDLNDNSIVVDLGSFEGNFANNIHIKYKCNVFGFEPLKKFYDLSKKKFQNSKVVFYNFALGSENKKTDIYVNKDETSLFFIENAVKEKIIIKKYEVIEELGLNKIDLLKMNIEGAEYDLLDYIIENKFIKKIKNLQIQFHTNVENYAERKKKIVKFLKKTHYRKWYFPRVWESWSAYR